MDFQCHIGLMRGRTVHSVKLKATEPQGYEFKVGPYDYHVRKEGPPWVLDQFRTAIADANDAHLDSIECENLDDAVLYALDEARPGRVKNA